MKIECELEKFKSAVLQAERITGKNLTLPILNSILLTASGKSLKLRATNLNLGIEIEIPAKVEISGVVAVSGSVVSGIFSNLFQNENVLLEDVGGNLIIKTKKSNLKLKGGQVDDFPTIPKVEGESFEIEVSKLIEGIKSVYYSASSTDIKPEISSVFVYIRENYLYFVSTDSFRLAEKKIKIKEKNNDFSVIIPFKNISEILRVFGEFKGNINICFNKNQISFYSNNVYLTSRIIDGVFPDYNQILPKEHKTEVIVLKQDLLNALKITNIFSDKFNQINILIKPKEKVFKIFSKNNDIGENETNLDGVMNGDEIELSFNYKYFLDCLSSINTDSLTIKLNENSKPIVISPVSDNSFTYLIMPMNR